MQCDNDNWHFIQPTSTPKHAKKIKGYHYARTLNNWPINKGQKQLFQ